MADEPSSNSGFGSVSVHQAKEALNQILSHVCSAKTRMEIVGADGHACVLISKDELESLERALEILANTSEVRKIATQIAALTYTAAQGPLVVAAADGESN
ncbi:MAG TPA: hypothetical protein VEA69_04655 [Tepidisphaeraceae bacterium]|nr:hypothetical protein [Tepidisphaeraceae bacterium]